MLFISDRKNNSFDFLKTIFKDYYNYEINKEDFIYNDYQKPYLKNNKYYFNISHTKDKIIICIDNQEVGIDIEQLRNYNQGVTKKIFTLAEQEYCRNNDLKFTEIFIKKESYAKYLGTGLGEYLADINVLNNPLIKIIMYQDYYIAVTNSNNLQIIEIK